MYLPQLFVEEDRELVLRILRENPLANIVSYGTEPMVNVAPTLVDDSEGQLAIRFHLAARNPQCEQLNDGARCLLVFTGPNCYVSPSWYTEHPNVPTWNYVTAHAHGRVEVMTESGLESFLQNLTRTHERLVGGTWRYEDMPTDFKRELLAEIRGFCVRVTRLEGKCKLSQNRTSEDRERVARRLGESIEPSARAVGRWMADKFRKPAVE